ncbi:hypothetical protein B7494_g520 [Chlorociboria aeruginascens]|nr:hypothetical protein B7494_g520 [Chlorociboria aeruginascens]
MPRRSHAKRSRVIDSLSDVSTSSAGEQGGPENQFQYTPLDTERNEIRLLRISPELNNSKFFGCELLHVPLDNAPPYQALSYAWGGRKENKIILINGRAFSVTGNLNQALYRLRPRKGDQELTLWVDAICINQTDIPERNSQTAQMKTIYQNAEGVSVWLGSEADGSTLAMDLARELNVMTVEEVAMALRDPSRIEQFKAMIILFRRRYWWRIWVLQEVYFSRRSTVYCGKDYIPWPDLENVSDILKQEEWRLQALFYKYPSYVRTLLFGGPRGLQLSRYSLTADSPSLLELLLSHKSKDSTDPRDKVYALVGMSDSANTFGNIDYSLSVRNVYAHTARHIISSTRKLDVICVKQADSSGDGLPSWIPDWRRPNLRKYHNNNSGYGLIGLHHCDSEFVAAGESLAEAEFLKDGMALRTAGVVIDTIKETGIPFKKTGAQSEVESSLKTFYQWWSLFVVNKAYPSRLKSIFSLLKEKLLDLQFNEPELAQSSYIKEDEETSMAIFISASFMINRRRLIITKSKIPGLAPWNSKEGDIVYVLNGCQHREVQWAALARRKSVQGTTTGNEAVGVPTPPASPGSPPSPFHPIPNATEALSSLSPSSAAAAWLAATYGIHGLQSGPLTPKTPSPDSTFGFDSSHVTKNFKTDLFEVRASPKGGLGVFALKDIEAGTVVHSEKPLFRADFIDVFYEHDKLSDAQKRVFKSLHCHRALHEIRTVAIYQTNRFGLVGGKPGVFVVASRFNHACVGFCTCSYKWSAANNELSFKANVDIKSGQELTIAYTNNPKCLLDNYGFHCDCEGCGPPPPVKTGRLLSKRHWW